MNLESKATTFLSAHRDIVLAVASSPKYLLSASKDKSIRLWEGEECVAMGSHTGSVSAVAVSPKTGSFFVTGSDDKTIKLWSFGFSHTKKFGDERDVTTLTPLTSAVAHLKEISSVAISPDEKMIATASADKTVKLWNIGADHEITPLHTLNHNRAVWSVAFSPVEKCIATACSDKRIRIWSLTGKCIKVLEGHETSVVKVAFINKGLQLVSSDANGLVKLWNIRSSEVLDTFDHHTARIWALVTRDDGRLIITGGEDSRINIWKDWTEGIVKEKRDQVDETLKQEQELEKLMRGGKFLDAIVLAISTDRPKKTYALLEKLYEKEDGDKLFRQVLDRLSYEEMTFLFQYAIDWNTNSRFASIAQKVLQGMLQFLDPNFINISYEKSVHALLAYSERHFKRVSSLLQNSYLLDYMLSNMRTAPSNTTVPEEDEEDDQPARKKQKLA
jgi:U3 small nucleolar RNA-associated protein 13